MGHAEWKSGLAQAMRASSARMSGRITSMHPTLISVAKKRGRRIADQNEGGSDGLGLWAV